VRGSSLGKEYEQVSKALQLGIAIDLHNRDDRGRKRERREDSKSWRCKVTLVLLKLIPTTTKTTRDDGMLCWTTMSVSVGHSTASCCLNAPSASDLVGP
jgi:hypothetical protein